MVERDDLAVSLTECLSVFPHFVIVELILIMRVYSGTMQRDRPPRGLKSELKPMKVRQLEPSGQVQSVPSPTVMQTVNGTRKPTPFSAGAGTLSAIATISTQVYDTRGQSRHQDRTILLFSVKLEFQVERN